MCQAAGGCGFVAADGAGTVQAVVFELRPGAGDSASGLTDWGVARTDGLDKRCVMPAGLSQFEFSHFYRIFLQRGPSAKSSHCDFRRKRGSCHVHGTCMKDLLCKLYK